MGAAKKEGAQYRTVEHQYDVQQETLEVGGVQFVIQRGGPSFPYTDETIGTIMERATADERGKVISLVNEFANSTIHPAIQDYIEICRQAGIPLEPGILSLMAAPQLPNACYFFSQKVIAREVLRKLGIPFEMVVNTMPTDVFLKDDDDHIKRVYGRPVMVEAVHDQLVAQPQEAIFDVNELDEVPLNQITVERPVEYAPDAPGVTLHDFYNHQARMAGFDGTIMTSGHIQDVVMSRILASEQSPAAAKQLSTIEMRFDGARIPTAHFESLDLVGEVSLRARLYETTDRAERVALVASAFEDQLDLQPRAIAELEPGELRNLLNIRLQLPIDFAIEVGKIKEAVPLAEGNEETLPVREEKQQDEIELRTYLLIRMLPFLSRIKQEKSMAELGEEDLSTTLDIIAGNVIPGETRKTLEKMLETLDPKRIRAIFTAIRDLPKGMGNRLSFIPPNLRMEAVDEIVQLSSQIVREQEGITVQQMAAEPTRYISTSAVFMTLPQFEAHQLDELMNEGVSVDSAALEGYVSLIASSLRQEDIFTLSRAEQVAIVNEFAERYRSLPSSVVSRLSREPIVQRRKAQCSQIASIVLQTGEEVRSLMGEMSTAERELIVSLYFDLEERFLKPFLTGMAPSDVRETAPRLIAALDGFNLAEVGFKDSLIIAVEKMAGRYQPEPQEITGEGATAKKNKGKQPNQIQEIMQHFHKVVEEVERIPALNSIPELASIVHHVRLSEGVATISKVRELLRIDAAIDPAIGDYLLRIPNVSDRRHDLAKLVETMPDDPELLAQLLTLDSKDMAAFQELIRVIPHNIEPRYYISLSDAWDLLNPILAGVKTQEEAVARIGGLPEDQRIELIRALNLRLPASVYYSGAIPVYLLGSVAGAHLWDNMTYPIETDADGKEIPSISTIGRSGIRGLARGLGKTKERMAIETSHSVQPHFVESPWAQKIKDTGGKIAVSFVTEGASQSIYPDGSFNSAATPKAIFDPEARKQMVAAAIDAVKQRFPDIYQATITQVEELALLAILAVQKQLSEITIPVSKPLPRPYTRKQAAQMIVDYLSPSTEERSQ